MSCVFHASSHRVRIVVIWSRSAADRDTCCMPLTAHEATSHTAVHTPAALIVWAPNAHFGGCDACSTDRSAKAPRPNAGDSSADQRAHSERQAGSGARFLELTTDVRVSERREPPRGSTSRAQQTTRR